MTSTPAQRPTHPVQDDSGCKKERVLHTVLGETIVRSVRVAAAARLSRVLKDIGFVAIPRGITVLDFLPDSARAELQGKSNAEATAYLVEAANQLGAGDRELIEQSTRQTMEAVFHWVCSIDRLAPVLLSALCVGVSEEQALEFELADVLNIIGTAIELTDVEATLAAFKGFSTGIGGLTGAFRPQSKASAPGATVEAARDAA